MKQKIEAFNNMDTHGNPAGGTVTGVGISIEWQNGPLGRGTDRAQPNGCFVETVLEAALQRLRYYQDTKFKCFENARAIEQIKQALDTMASRTYDREQHGVEGTHGTRPGKEGPE